MKAAAGKGFSIRLARPGELKRLTEIELDAFATLAEAQGDDREAHALPETELRLSLESGLLFVAADGEDRPVGFLAGSEMDGALYVKELDVARYWQRKGIGRQLMAVAIEGAPGQGLWGATLTTDRYVPFNALFMRPSASER